MSRQFSTLRFLLVGVLVAALGCAPQQPFFFLEDGDLSHYVDKATEIEYPDVESCTLDEVTGAGAPLTLKNPDPSEIWEATLEEAIKIALENSKVVRTLAGSGAVGGGFGPQPFLVDSLQRAGAATTVYDPALTEANPRFGVEAALAAFDAQFLSSASWEKNDQPQNIAGAFTQFRPGVFSQDLGTFQARLRKTAATGATWSLSHNVRYEWNNVPVFDGLSGSRRFASDWNVDVEAEVRQPLLQGAGVQYNRIAGPGAIPGFNNGVMIARLNTDMSLVDFEAQIRNLVSDVENAYWTLYSQYRALDANVEARDQALDTWRKVRVEYETGTVAAHDEAQARWQYFDFRRAVETALTGVYNAEANLRLMMGLAASDGRLIRPADEPTTAKIDFDWYETHSEALVRNVHIRRQKWLIKQRELELIAAKNYLLPRLDSVARYRWLGFGDHLIDTERNSDPLHNAFQSLTGGDYQEWHLGLELSVPLGFRKELAGVRYAQLALARERAAIQDLELEVSHALSTALRELEYHYTTAQTYHNQRVAAETELASWEARERQGLPIREGSLDRKLDAQRRLLQAKLGYYGELVHYNRSIVQVHFRKNSLLEYNGVYLAEGPWPQKAYFDALRRARARDAGFYLDYGFTRPKVVSRGPVDQHAGQAGPIPEGEPTPAGDVFPEMIPAPEPLKILPDEPPAPNAAALEPVRLRSTAVSTDRRAPVQPSVAGAQMKAAGSSGSQGDRAEHDLAAVDWKAFDTGPAKAEASPSRPPAGVQTASYQKADPAPKAAQKARVAVGWTKSASADAPSKSAANPPAGEPDSSGLRWRPVRP